MQGILLIDYLEKGRTVNSEYYIALLVLLKEEIAKKTATNEKGKVLLHQDYAQYQKSIVTMAKLHEVHFELLLHPSYSQNLAHSDYWQFADFKRILQVNRFSSSEEGTSETKAYFEAKDKSFHKNGIKFLEKHWNKCITLDRDC